MKAEKHEFRTFYGTSDFSELKIRKLQDRNAVTDEKFMTRNIKMRLRHKKAIENMDLEQFDNFEKLKKTSYKPIRKKVRIKGKSAQNIKPQVTILKANRSSMSKSKRNNSPKKKSKISPKKGTSRKTKYSYLRNVLKSNSRKRKLYSKSVDVKLDSKFVSVNSKGSKFSKNGQIGNKNLLKRSRIHSAGFFKNSLAAKIRQKSSKQGKRPSSTEKSTPGSAIYKKVRSKAMKTLNLLSENRNDLRIAAGGKGHFKLIKSGVENKMREYPSKSESKIGELEIWDRILNSKGQSYQYLSSNFPDPNRATAYFDSALEAPLLNST